MNKRIKIYLVMAVCSIMLSCTSKEEKSIENAEATVADIEAAQMQGREEARKFINRKWQDSLELHNQLLEVAAVRSRYVEQKRNEECNAFDSAFISTVKTVRPGLAAQIERHRRGQ